MAIGDQPPPRIPSRVRPKRGEKGSITFRGRLIVSRHGRPDGTHRQRTLPNNRYGCSGNRAANNSIHHARKVTAYLDEHPRLELLYGARYSPDDNPAERVWGALKNYVANTAVTWPGRLRQIHSFFRARSPDQMLATAAPWTSPWLPPGYEQNFWNGA